MSNHIYDMELFNKEQKEMFLDGLTDRSRVVHDRILKRAALVEEQVGKDLYDFSIGEIEMLMNTLAPTTFVSSYDQLSSISQYIKWAIQQGLRKDNINPILAVKDDDYVRKFIDDTNKYLFTEIEISEIVSKLLNFQDSAIIQCAFEGIVGNLYSEMLNLTKNDIDLNENIITVRNTSGTGETTERTINITSKLMKMLEIASKETEYLKNNGNMVSTAKASAQSKLVENEYVFRASDINTKEYGKASSHLISRRIKNISSWFDYSHLTITNIRKSGMLKMGFDLFKVSNKFDREEIKEICKHFNIDSKITTRIEKDFLNFGNIESLYINK